MKITFLGPPLNMGGGTKVIAIYADYFARNGHDVLVVSQPNAKPRLTTRIKNLFRLKFFYSRTQRSHFDGLNVKQHVIEKYRPIVSDDLPDADVVIATWWETAEWLEKIDLKKGKKIYFIQGYEIFDYIPKERAIATYKSHMHKIVISKWLKDIMQKEYDNTDIDLVSNAVDKSHFYFTPRQKQKTPTVGFLVSNSYVKAVDIAIKVVMELKKTYPNLNVITFGAYALKDSSLLASGDNFHLSPTIDEIREIYAKCDVWLAASRSEGFNLTAMEAMACGTPIVSTKTGWPIEAVIPYKNGVLTEIDDVLALSEGAKWILQQTEEAWQTLSQNAAHATEGYSWEKSASKFEQILKEQMNISHAG